MMMIMIFDYCIIDLRIKKACQIGLKDLKEFVINIRITFITIFLDL